MDNGRKNMTSSQSMYILCSKFSTKPNIRASQRQSKGAIKRWDLRKNLKTAKAAKMLRIKDKRGVEGKDTEFRFYGQPVSDQNLERARKRFKETDTERKSTPLVGKHLVFLPIEDWGCFVMNNVSG